MFWLLHRYCVERKVEIKWIFLEAGHGKGIPYGIGAAIKKAISDILVYNPQSSVYTANDLFNHGLQESIPSIQMHIYTKDEILNLRSSIPSLEAVAGTTKLHEVDFRIQEAADKF